MTREISELSAPDISNYRQDLFWKKVVKTDSCWNWKGAVSADYGSFWIGKSTIGSHKYSWIIVNGIVSEGLELDHTCCNKLCVNPDHLEAVSHQVNIQRIFDRKSKRIRCSKGHSLEDSYSKPNGSTGCRTCKKNRERVWKKEWRKRTGKH